MTLITMCALCPPMCRLTQDPDIRSAVAELAAQPSPAPQETDRLITLMHRRPDDVKAVLALTPTLGSETLALMHLCGQCEPGELLEVLCRCTTAPTAEGLALLISEHRRMQAMARYGLQLLWRLCGDASLPDALSLFPEERTKCSADGIVHSLVRQLKGGAALD